MITFKRRILPQHHPTETILVTELKSYKIKAKLLCESPIFLPPTRMYSRRRIYQYNEDEFRFNFFLFLTAWIHINMETERSSKLTASFCVLVNNVD